MSWLKLVGSLWKEQGSGLEDVEMADVRASKRRKLDTGSAAPVTVNESLAQEVVTQGLDGHEPQETVPKPDQAVKQTPTRVSSRKRARSDADALTVTNQTPNGHAAPKTPASGRRATRAAATPTVGSTGQLSAVKKTPNGNTPISTGKGKPQKPVNGHADGDVEMADAPESSSREHLPAPVAVAAVRTSGRQRQNSRRLAEAKADSTAVARASPAASLREERRTATPVRDSVKASTPSRTASARGRRKTVTPKRPKEAEVPDSEPEADKTVQPAPAPDRMTEASKSPPLVIPVIELNLTPSRKQKADVEPKHGPTKAAAALQSLLPKNASKVLPATAQLNGTVLQDEESAVVVDEDYEFPSNELEAIHAALIQKLSRRAGSKLMHVDQETAKVANLIQQTVTAGESNSMVVIGARGSGKTTLMNNIIGQQRALYGDNFHVVRLSGFIHTDDKIAIREIWRQLGREMEVEDDKAVKNYADTMTTLLALLSHPSEIGQQQQGIVSKSVVILLDEFDLFTTHPRQTLLYNLFDIAQSRKAPIAVLGLTTRFDIAEALEKRVKSRFSHRQVYLPLAKNFSSFKEMCKASLVVSASECSPAPSGSCLQHWAGLISKLFDSSTTINNLLQSIYHTTKSVPTFQTSCLIPFGTMPLDKAHSFSTITEHLETQLTLAPPLTAPDSALTLLSSLSTLELALLICASRLLVIHDAESVSFPLAYEEYKSLASKARIAASASGALATGAARVWGQGVARAAWDGLLEKGLAIAVGAGLCRVDVSMEELGVVADNNAVEIGGMAKWCKDL